MAAFPENQLVFDWKFEVGNWKGADGLEPVARFSYPSDALAYAISAQGNEVIGGKGPGDWIYIRTNGGHPNSITEWQLKELATYLAECAADGHITQRE